MSRIQVEHLTFSYPSGWDTIFDDVSFQIDTDWRLGFVGRNGKGKTTFLRLLMGEYEYRGKILSSVPFDYFPYAVADPGRPTAEVLQSVCPQAAAWELLRELSCLEVRADVLQRPFETLSNGERTKALLAALFLNEGRFLLIDEPTNHLDAKARAVTAAYLQRKKGFILVSHDRRFLDTCVDHILSLNRADIEVQSGNFTSWMENFENRQASELAQNERLQSDIKRLKQAAARTAVWSDRVEASKAGSADKGYVGHKAAKMMKRSKSIEARQQKAVEEKSGLLKNIERAEPLKLSPLRYHSERLAAFDEVAVSYDGVPVCGPLSFEIPGRPHRAGGEKRQRQEQPAQTADRRAGSAFRNGLGRERAGDFLCAAGRVPLAGAFVRLRAGTPARRKSVQGDFAEAGFRARDV